jgi:hypothetical protein
MWELCPDLPKGWYEVIQLSTKDRLDFVHGYWLQQLPFLPHMQQAITAFFGRVDEICVYLVQPHYQDPFHAEMVYSLAGNAGFYRGCAPALPEQIDALAQQFPDRMLPKDYVAFLGLHSGFSKLMDSGVLTPDTVLTAYERVQVLINQQQQPLVDKNQQLVDPATLIPFYESFSLPSYQCFWSDWYPEDEMGNIYFSGLENSISDVQEADLWTENLAFPTFLDWLAFYLEAID